MKVPIIEKINKKRHEYGDMLKKSRELTYTLGKDAIDEGFKTLKAHPETNKGIVRAVIALIRGS